jgi:putative DNA primase/helicase
MNIESKFKQAALSVGIAFDGDIIADGSLHRIHIQGHRTGSRNGAYVLHIDGRVPAGWALDYKTNTTMIWRADGQKPQLSATDRAAIAAERQQREVEQQKAYRVAADKARSIWAKAQTVTDSNQHPYLIKKRIQAHGVRLSVWQGRQSLVIPIMGEQGLISLQFIEADGSKHFLPGGKIKGGFFGIGLSGIVLDEPRRILIAEGFATGASVYEWFNEPCIVAFNAGNLESVAKRIRVLYPKREIIICGDHDASGTGQKAAKMAARTVGGRYLLPSMVGTDFNDAVNAWKATMSARADS